MNTLHLINGAVGLAAFVVMVPFLDRLRSMSWRTHQAAVVGMHLGLAVWLGFLAFHGLFARDLHSAHDIAAVIGCACWLRVSRATWRGGHAPAHTETAPAHFDALPHR